MAGECSDFDAVTRGVEYLEARQLPDGDWPQEGIAGVRVIQAYAREPETKRRFGQSNRDLYDSHLHSVKVSTWYFGLVEACGVLRRRRPALGSAGLRLLHQSGVCRRLAAGGQRSNSNFVYDPPD